MEYYNNLIVEKQVRLSGFHVLKSFGLILFTAAETFIELRLSRVTGLEKF